MGNDAERCVVIFSLTFYVAVTILLYLALSGADWSRYENGHSGLWHHCNSSSKANSRGSMKDKKPEECEFISIVDAKGLLHVVRAFYITGFTGWCLSLIYRRVTWGNRGTFSDHIFNSVAFSIIVLIATGNGVYTKYHHDEFASNDYYQSVRYSYNFFLSIGNCVCLIVVIILTTRNYVQNKRLVHPRPRSCSRKWKDCRWYTCLPFCKDRSSSDRSSSPAHSARPESSLRSSNALWHRQDSSRRINVTSVSWITDFSSSTRTSNDSSRGHRSWRRHSRVSPSDAIIQPPSYEESSRNRDGEENSNSSIPGGQTPGFLPPPAYEEVVARRELILSPPPAYSELSPNET